MDRTGEHGHDDREAESEDHRFDGIHDDRNIQWLGHDDGQQPVQGRHISGSISLDKGLKSVASGGDCTVTGKLKNFGVTAIAFHIH